MDGVARQDVDVAVAPPVDGDQRAAGLERCDRLVPKCGQPVGLEVVADLAQHDEVEALRRPVGRQLTKAHLDVPERPAALPCLVHRGRRGVEREHAVATAGQASRELTDGTARLERRAVTGIRKAGDRDVVSALFVPARGELPRIRIDPIELFERGHGHVAHRKQHLEGPFEADRTWGGTTGATFDRLVLRGEAVERVGLALPRRERERHPDGPVERELGRRRPVPRPDRVGRQRDPIPARVTSGRPARLVVGVPVPRQRGHAPVGTDGAGQPAPRSGPLGRSRPLRLASRDGRPRPGSCPGVAQPSPAPPPARARRRRARRRAANGACWPWAASPSVTATTQTDHRRPAALRSAHPPRASRRPGAATRPRRAHHRPAATMRGGAPAPGSTAPRTCQAHRRTRAGWDGDRTRPPAPTPPAPMRSRVPRQPQRAPTFAGRAPGARRSPTRSRPPRRRQVGRHRAVVVDGRPHYPARGRWKRDAAWRAYHARPKATASGSHQAHYRVRR